MLATIDDLAALGAVPTDWFPTEPESMRATRLLEMAQALALDYLNLEESDVTGWPQARQTRLVTWIAEKASTRLNVSAAPSVDPYGQVQGPMSMKLNTWEKEDLREIGRKFGLAVIDTTRGDALITPVEEYDPFSAGWPAL